MTWLDTFKTRLNAWLGNADSATEEFGDHYSDQIDDPNLEGSTTGPLGLFLVTILLIPIQIVTAPFKLLGLFHNSGIDVELEQEYAETTGADKFRLGAKRTLGSLVTIPYLLLTAPIRLLRGLSSASAFDAIFSIPAIVMFFFFLFVFGQVYFRAEVIQNRYAKGAGEAVAAKDFQLAKTYFQRLLQQGDLSQPMQLTFVTVLQQTGEFDRAKELLDRLAPEESVGFDPAHRAKAIVLAQRIADGKETSNTMERLRRHLNRTNDRSPELLQAWGIYYQKLENHDKAIENFKAAARQNPLLFVPLSNYLSFLRRSSENEVILEEASKVFEDRLFIDESDESARINLANIYSRTGRVDDAEQLLLSGNRNSPELRYSLASFYCMRYDLAKINGVSLEKQLEILLDALTFDKNHPNAYSRLMKVYSSEDKTAEDIQRIKNELRDIIATGKPSGLAHFVLSSILINEGDTEKAIFHLKQARKIDRRLAFTANNLAWLYAHQSPPDLETAMQFADEAIKNNPIDGRFRDTRGTILMKLKEYEDAISEFQIALRAPVPVRAPKLVHKKLSTAYTALGMEDMAKKHLRISQ